MRLLHVTHQYPPAIGGSEKYIADLSESLAARGHHVDVYTSRSRDYRTWANELPARAQVGGVLVRRFWSVRRTPLLWRVLDESLRRYWARPSAWYEPFILIGGGPLCPGMFIELLRTARRYDLVHLNCLVYSHAFYAYLAARRQGVPVVLTPHVHAGQRETYGLGYQMRVLRGSARVFADTEAERSFLVRLGLDPDRVHVAGVGVRPETHPRRDPATCRRRLGLPESAFVLLFLGRQVAYKGLAAVVEAFRALRQQHSHVHLLVVGPETPFSHALFRGCTDEPGLTNLGAVTDDVRLDALNAADCLVLPSAGEAFGIVFLEAWVVGKPVVGPETDAAASLIDHGRDGWLVSLNDPDGIARAVEQWIRSPDLASRMGEAGRVKALSRYTSARITDVVERVCESVVAENRLARASAGRPAGRVGGGC